MVRHDHGFWSDAAFRRWVHRLTNRLFGTFGNLKFYGRENFPREGGVLLAANHVSYLDPLIIGSTLQRELSYMARKSAFKNPLLGAFLRGCNCYPIERGVADLGALRHTISLIRSDKAVLIFPEGTRGTGGKLGKANDGLAFLVSRVKVPVIPVFVGGTDQFLPRGAWHIKPAQLTVTFGTPVDFSEIEPIDEKRERYRLIGEKVMSEIAKLSSR